MYYRKYERLTPGEVTCANVYLNILCLGTSNGSVFLFTLSDPVDLLRLDTLSTRVEHSVTPCGQAEQSVTSVRMSVVSSGDNGVQLVMVTGDTLGQVSTLTWRSEFTRNLPTSEGSDSSEQRYVLSPTTLHMKPYKNNSN